MVVHNGFEFDYPVAQALESLVLLCDEVVVVEREGSIMNVIEAIKQWIQKRRNYRKKRKQEKFLEEFRREKPVWWFK